LPVTAPYRKSYFENVFRLVRRLTFFCSWRHPRRTAIVYLHQIWTFRPRADGAGTFTITTIPHGFRRAMGGVPRQREQGRRQPASHLVVQHQGWSFHKLADLHTVQPAEPPPSPNSSSGHGAGGAQRYGRLPRPHAVNGQSWKAFTPCRQPRDRRQGGGLHHGGSQRGRFTLFDSPGSRSAGLASTGQPSRFTVRGASCRGHLRRIRMDPPSAGCG